jgi:hypothetical protein
MNASMDQILAGYTADQLDVLASFLRRTTDAGQAATSDLAAVTRFAPEATAPGEVR